MTKFCVQCQNVGAPKKFVPGSILIELILWMLFLIPGLLYSIWRVSNKKRICRMCGATNLVPLDSPIAKRLSESIVPKEAAQ